MAIQIVFETHSTSVDNERGIASGWSDPPLSPLGRRQAEALGTRRRRDGIQAVFASDLRRAAETAQIAFGTTGLPIFHDWRLRECNYGDLNGGATSVLHGGRAEYLAAPHPNGESWRQAVTRIERFLVDLPRWWAGGRVLVVGHIATRWGFEHWLNGVALEDLCATEFVWQPGWEYRLP